MEPGMRDKPKMGNVTERGSFIIKQEGFMMVNG